MINFGMQPFWFWNGDMADDEIVRQIREMKNKGIGGFFIHPRQGLEIPYLSKEWFDKVGVAVDEAGKLGLNVWLYDEFPYPSGIAGGEVLCGHPEFEASVLKHFRFDVRGGQKVVEDLPFGTVVSARAYPVTAGKVDWRRYDDLRDDIGICGGERIFQLSGLTTYNRKRFFEKFNVKRLSYTPGQGEWRIYIFVEVPLENVKYFGRFIDPLNHDAVARFISVTHEQYKKHLGHAFGNTIQGIFSDEIEPNPHGAPIRWSAQLSQLFERKNGYSLLEYLPALFEEMDRNTHRIRYDYWNTITDGFIDSYDKQIWRWCRSNNLLYAAEKPILRSSQLSCMDIPGMDAGHQKTGSAPNYISPDYRANPKILTSAAHFYKKERALVECYHSVGWGMTLQDMKWMIDWLAVQGLDLFVPHAFFYSTDGLKKHDAPPSSFLQQPSWKHMGVLSDYLEAVCRLLNSSNRKVDVLLVDPVTSQWTVSAEGPELKERLREDFGALQKELLQNHIDYYIIDPELLAKSTVKEDVIEINGEKFNFLVLPPMLNIEMGAMEKIMEYSQQGGHLIAAACLPVENIGGGLVSRQFFEELFEVDAMGIYNNYRAGKKGNPIKASFKRNTAYFAAEIRDAALYIRSRAEKELSILVDGSEAHDILSAHYSCSQGSFCFLVNTAHRRLQPELGLTSPSSDPISPYRLYPETGKRIPLHNFARKEGCILLPLSLAPLESCIILLEQNKLHLASEEEGEIPKLKIDTKGLWHVQPARMNALRLDDWKLSIVTDNEEHMEIPVQSEGCVHSKPIIDQLEEVRALVPVALRQHFGCPKEMSLPPLQVSCSTVFKWNHPADGIWLVMEPGSICGEWFMLVNGHRVEPDDFIVKEFYSAGNLGYAVGAFLRQGDNRIEVCVRTNRSDDGVVNPIYLFGDFGVYKAQDGIIWEATARPQKGIIGDMAANGIPFYAGEIVYKKTIHLDEPLGDRIFEINATADPVELHINGVNMGVAAWSPYRWRVGADTLQAGENRIELHICNTLIGLFEGQQFVPALHRYVDC